MMVDVVADDNDDDDDGGDYGHRVYNTVVAAALFLVLFIQIE